MRGLDVQPEDMTDTCSETSPTPWLLVKPGNGEQSWVIVLRTGATLIPGVSGMSILVPQEVLALDRGRRRPANAIQQ